jgi:hypothetical protein
VLFLQDNAASHASHHTAKVGWSTLWGAGTHCLFTWSGPFILPFVPKREKPSEWHEIFDHWGCRRRLQPNLQPNLQHSISVV